MSAVGASSSRKRPHPASDGSRPAYPRKRAAQACTTCRKRRVKCDNERPSCTSCVKLGVQCVYQESDKSSFDAASIAILNRLDDLENLVRTFAPEALGEPEAGTPDIERSATPAASPEVYRINVEAILEWPVVRAAASKQPQSLASIFQPNPPASDASGPRLLSTSDLDADSTGHLLQSFIQNFHIYNPVLEIAQIEEYVKLTLFNGPGWDARSCISLLVFALGTLGDVDEPASSTSMAFRQSKQFQDAESFFFAAQRRMGHVICNGGLAEAQIFFLAGVYLMATMRPFEAWRLFVQALACCQVLESSSNDPNRKESQLHKSIYWTSFKSELELRLELGITENSARNLRYPQFFPAPPRGLQSEGEAGWYYYLAEIALRRLGNRILTDTSVFKFTETTAEEKVARIVEFERQAQSWVESLPQDLKLQQSPGASPSSQGARLRFILNGHLVDCYEMMYWPFIVDAIHGTLPDDADSAILAHKGFQMSVRRIEENEAGFHHRHHGAWLMLRSCTRSALVLIAAARAGLDDVLPDGWQASVLKVAELLRYWKDEVADVAFRLELLETLMQGMKL